MWHPNHLRQTCAATNGDCQPEVWGLKIGAKTPKKKHQHYIVIRKK